MDVWKFKPLPVGIRKKRIHVSGVMFVVRNHLDNRGPCHLINIQTVMSNVQYENMKEYEDFVSRILINNDNLFLTY